ncbi:MAG: adenylyl-sulfate kinase [Verrucomicrobiota bacterium]
MKSDNITLTLNPVTREHRAELLRHCGFVLWLTGLSGSGKSTFAVQMQKRLHLRGMAAFILDGDNLRHGLCSNLGFTPEDRSENIRRVGEVAKLMAEAGLIAICSLISPYQADRNRVRESCRRDGIPFAEVFVNTPLEVCEARDPRGLYKRARAGEIKDFTGVNAPYESPGSPELEIRTAESSAESSLAALMDLATDLADNFSRTSVSGPGYGI